MQSGGRVAAPVAALLLLASVLAPRLTVADEAATSARTHFEAGRKLFAKREFVAAAREFEQAAAAKAHPSALINAADAWERAGELVLAARDLDRASALPAVSAADRREIDSALARLGPQLVRLQIDLAAGEQGRVTLDGDEISTGPTWVTPGKHRLEMHRSGEVRTKQLDAAAGARVRIAFSSAPTGPEPGAPPAEARPKQPHGGIRPVTWAAIAGTGIGLGVTIYFGLQTQAAAARYDDHPNVDDRDTVNRDRLVTNIALGTTVVAAAVSTVLLIGDLGRSPSQTAVSRATRPRRGWAAIEPRF